MVSDKQFIQYSYPEKKQILVDIFAQLNDKNISFEDTIFLLQSSDKIKEVTLDKIYATLFDLLQSNKSISQQNYLDRLHAIQNKIYNDAEKESAEADSLLDTL